MPKKFYAYFFEDNKNYGIVNDWEECKKIVSGTKARYKSFKTKDEALSWIKSGANYEKHIKNIKEKKNIELEDAIYFDSGTGRGRGVEVRVTDKYGISLLDEKKFSINEFSNIDLGRNRTNNYGELYALNIAIDIALEKNIKLIIGDSQLAIFYWSIGRFHEENLEEDTILLIKNTIDKRKEYENLGGKISFISGDFNPADLGFHK